ncbi:hypothetical protein BG011_005743 [Mortierella polycephala]|uniref:Prolyl endopeptidase n=1 Tax=Mortierella polycephala TaxID=41804 RepID=A0A9P6U960_9FUNG|nr:hypothetical protein BG011_005743 [Mortierella polycephala]
MLHAEPVGPTSLDGKIAYPAVRRTDFTETLHGVTVADPYRWLEGQESEEIEEFIKAQNKIAHDFENRFEAKGKFQERLTELYNYERSSAPHRRGDHYYFFRNTGLQPQSILYQQDTIGSEARVFLDPNTFSTDGSACLATQQFSHSGKIYGYSISKIGADWASIYFMDSQGNKLDDKLEWLMFTPLAFTHDDKGVFYDSYGVASDLKKEGRDFSKLDGKNVCYHKMGTAQSEDIVVYSPSEPQYSPQSMISDDGRYMIINVVRSTDPMCKLYLIDLEAYGYNIVKDMEIIKVVDEFAFQYSYLTNEGTVFYFQTNRDAPLYKIVKYDLTKPEQGFTDVVPQAKEVLSCSTVIDNDKLIVQYIQDVKSVIRIHDLHTGEYRSQVPLPIGNVAGIAGEKNDKEFFLQFMSFLSPGTIYRYSFKPEDEGNRLSIFRQAKVKNFDSDDFVTKQVFYESKDGTKVPMFISHKKDLVLDGNNPAYIHGYGGFSMSILAAYTPSLIVFMRNLGGVVAYTNIRGGGEYGEEWHRAGALLNKQNCFDDFYYGARYLIKEKYSSAPRIAANGASNGGLLCAAAINQAPELFGCVVADVGSADMLRFHKFTIGHNWQAEYGYPEESKEDFMNLLSYSPVHNVHRKHPYPAVALFTSSHDDRVPPMNSYKFVAELQHTAGPLTSNPIVAHIETNTGHGAGKAITKRITETTDKFAFIAYTIGAKWTD